LPAVVGTDGDDDEDTALPIAVVAMGAEALAWRPPGNGDDADTTDGAGGGKVAPSQLGAWVGTTGNANHSSSSSSPPPPPPAAPAEAGRPWAASWARDKALTGGSTVAAAVGREARRERRRGSNSPARRLFRAVVPWSAAAAPPPSQPLSSCCSCCSPSILDPLF
jgi:hypothetical protein